MMKLAAEEVEWLILDYCKGQIGVAVHEYTVTCTRSLVQKHACLATRLRRRRSCWSLSFSTVMNAQTHISFVSRLWLHASTIQPKSYHLIVLLSVTDLLLERTEWLKDSEMPLIVDEIFVEMHYHHVTMTKYHWTPTRFNHSRADATEFFNRLRAAGFFVHPWP